MRTVRTLERVIFGIWYSREYQVVPIPNGWSTRRVTVYMIRTSWYSQCAASRYLSKINCFCVLVSLQDDEFIKVIYVPLDNLRETLDDCVSRGFVVDVKLYTFAMGLEWNLARNTPDINTDVARSSNVESISQNKNAPSQKVSQSSSSDYAREGRNQQTSQSHSTSTARESQSQSEGDQRNPEHVQEPSVSFVSSTNVRTLALGTLLGVALSGLVLGARTLFVQNRRE